MSAPLLDFHLRWVIEFAISEIIKDPDRKIREIFGDAKLEPHAAMMGDYFLNNAKKFFTDTKIHVNLGYDIDPTQLPCVTISLQSSQPAQRYMGDASFMTSRTIQPQEKTPEVDWFSPKKITRTATSIELEIEPTTPNAWKVLPGLRFQDQSYQEYNITQENGKLYLIPIEGGASLEDCNPNRLRVVTPYNDVQFRQGAMLFDDIANITVYGHANRIEGYYLWAAIQHSILKYRPLLESVFGLQMTEPVSSDYQRDDAFMGENVWRRYITVATRSMWTWEGPDQADVAAFAVFINGLSAQYPNSPVPLDQQTYTEPPVPPGD